MKTGSIISLFILAAIQAFCTNVQVGLMTKDKDDLEHLSSIEILDATGNRIVQKDHLGERLSVDFADSISGRITIRINAGAYFPIEITYEQQPGCDSILISDVLLVPALRRKLPGYATCGTFAPRKRDIPKKIAILINSSKYLLVPDKNDVVGISYIGKE